MRVLEKAGLVQLDDEAAGLPQVRVDLAPASAEVAPATGDDPAPPSLPDSTTDPSVVAVAEQRPFAAIYTGQALATSSFPAEKLLFEDDLMSIPKQGVPGKAGARQAGLYQAVKVRGLVVETVVQSWPVTESGVGNVVITYGLPRSRSQK